MSKDEIYSFTIPDNVLDSKRLFGFRRANIINAIICIAIVSFIIYSIPFVFRVKMIILASIDIPIALINLIGVNDQCLSEAFFNFYVAIKNSGKYHLRSSANDPREKKQRRAERRLSESNTTSVYGASAADKTLEYIKKILRENGITK